MPGEKTIRDALLELRQLIAVNKGAADVALKHAEEGLERVRSSLAAADAASETLDRITTQLGFSVALESMAASSQNKRKDEEPEPERLTRKKKAAKGKKKRATLVAEPADKELTAEAVDPRFRFKLTDELNETDIKFFQLLQKNWPEFTPASAFHEKGWILNEKVASPTITRLRKKGVPIESAKQARDRGEDIDVSTSGWRLIVDRRVGKLLA